MRPTVYVLNGPNLNLLGSRQPEIYGRETLADVEAECRRAGTELGLEIEFRQTNAEFQLIDWIHEAGGRAAGIVINPAAFSHTSVAVLDALNTCTFPILEVHISNIHKREEFRHTMTILLLTSPRSFAFSPTVRTPSADVMSASRFPSWQAEVGAKEDLGWPAPGQSQRPSNLDPFKLALVKTELEGGVGRRHLSRV
jgi:3-dehydroquinate dehydratase II